MAVDLIAPAIPDLSVPRAFPCTAWSGDGKTQCGATPADRWWVICQHCPPEQRDLCAVHAAMARAMNGTCRRCATLGARAHPCPVAVVASTPARAPARPEPRMLIVGTTPGRR